MAQQKQLYNIAALNLEPLSRWTASERWHSKQVGRFLEDGSYELKVPYSKEPELIIDIMKYGPDVEVVEPQELREKIQETLKKTLRNYT